MDDMTTFEDRFEDRLRAFALAGVRPVDSASVAHAVAVGHPRGRGAGTSVRWLGLTLDRRTLTMVIAVGLLVAMLGGVLLIGARLLAPPTLEESLPANGWIAFTVWEAAPAAVDNHGDAIDTDTDIWLTSLDGDARRVVGGDADAFHQECPTFSPDGRSLAYGRIGVRTPGYESLRPAAIVVADVSDGGRVTDRLAIDVGNERNAPCPVWSPDGGQLAFRVDRATDGESMTAVGSEVRIVDLANQGVTVLPDLLATDLEWSPDGNTLAIASGLDEPVCCWALGDGQIHLYSPSSGGMRTLDQTLGAVQLTWSPDGREIVYTAIPRARDDATNELRVIDIDTGRQRKLAGPFPIMFGIGPVWSPDGTTIAYQRGECCTEHSEVVLLAAADLWDESVSPRGTVVPLTARDSSERLSPHRTTWSPDGRYLFVNAWGHAPDTAPGTREDPFLVAIPIDPATEPVVLSRMDGIGDESWGPAPTE